MKKASLLLFAILLASVINFSYGRNENRLSTTPPSGGITTLVINADVTVVLVNNHKARPTIKGGESIANYVTLKKQGDTLIIAATKNKNFRQQRVVYIPANELREVRVNNQAHVTSLYALQIRKLNLVINAECEFSITNIGEISMSSTELYAYLETTEIFRRPAKVLVSR